MTELLALIPSLLPVRFIPMNIAGSLYTTLHRWSPLICLICLIRRHRQPRYGLCYESCSGPTSFTCWNLGQHRGLFVGFFTTFI